VGKGGEGGVLMQGTDTLVGQGRRKWMLRWDWTKDCNRWKEKEGRRKREGKRGTERNDIKE
jgi:hypothetical protein